MDDSVRAGVATDGEAPINPYSLLEAVNDSSETVNTSWLIFIAIMSYLLVAVAGVTHKDLLLARDIPLPILQVGIGMTRFFLFAPFLLVLFHVGVVTQLVMLARKTLELDRSLQILEATDRRTHPLRLELNNFFFVQAIAGPERSSIVSGLLHGLSWLTLVVLPVVLLLYIQVSFLPYHDILITWAHRVALVGDILLLASIGVFLTRPEQSLATALARASVKHPLTFLLTTVVFGAVALFSFTVATIPGERLDRLSRQFMGEGAGPASLDRDRAVYGFVLPFMGVSTDGRLLGTFERNLNVTDLDLVIDKDVTPGEPTLNLRRRDLRYARLDRTDIHQADMTGANLDGASLVGADLRNVTLRCGDINLLLLTEDRKAARCPSARGANFTKARLGQADMAGLDLTGARMEEADLAGARLNDAALAGANLYSAHLEAADLTGGIAMQGVNLATAAVQGADLTGAKMAGAALTRAGLQGAVLKFVDLSGANLSGADLEGATLDQASLAGADLTGANTTAASLREAWVWRTRPPVASKARLLDLTGARLTPPSKDEMASMEGMLARIGNAGLRQTVREAMGDVLSSDSGRPAAASRSADAAAWRALVEGSSVGPSARSGPAMVRLTANIDDAGEARQAASGPAAQPAATPQATPPADGLTDAGRAGSFGERLTSHLGSLACKPRWARGGVATGIAQRVQSAGFPGDMATFYRRLSASECPASKTVSPAILQGLATKVDALRDR